MADRPPERFAAEGVLEVVNGQARDRVGHLLMKLGRAFAGCESVLRQQRRIVEVHRFVETAAAGINIGDIEIFAARPGFETLPGDLDGDLADGHGLIVSGQTGINGEGPQASKGRVGQCVPAGDLGGLLLPCFAARRLKRLKWRGAMCAPSSVAGVNRKDNRIGEDCERKMPAKFHFGAIDEAVEGTRARAITAAAGW